MNRNDAASGLGQPGIRGAISFDSMLDETCERLMDRQLEHSVLRIRELERRLGALEGELDEFLRGRPGPEKREGRKAVQAGPFCR